MHDNQYTDLESRSKKDKIPIISQTTARFLTQFLQKTQPKICLEIGSAAGYSTAIIAETIQPRGGLVYSFEISLPQYKKCIHNLGQYKVRNATCYHFDGTQTGVGMKKFIYENMDFCFVDGQKAQYHRYVQSLLPHMTSNATIICDDCIKYQSRMKSLYEYLEEKQIIYQTIQLDEDDGILIISLKQQKNVLTLIDT